MTTNEPVKMYPSCIAIPVTGTVNIIFLMVVIPSMFTILLPWYVLSSLEDGKGPFDRILSEFREAQRRTRFWRWTLFMPFFNVPFFKGMLSEWHLKEARRAYWRHYAHEFNMGRRGRFALSFDYPRYEIVQIGILPYIR